MQLASLIIASASLVVSATTLVVIIVGARKAQTIVQATTNGAQAKIDRIKRAVAEL